MNNTLSAVKKPLVVLYQPRKDEEGCVNTPPYALLALAAVLVDEFHVLIFDGALVSEPWRDIDAVCGEQPILAFGVTVITGPPILDARRFSQEARSRYAGTPVVWGGCHPSIDPEGTLRDGCVDFVILGQGEIPFREFLRQRRDGISPSNIPGLCYITDDVVQLTRPIAPQKLSSFPPRPFHLVDLSKYVRNINTIGKCIVYITSQGCPYQCYFCSDTALYGTHWSGYAVEEMIRDVRMLYCLDISFLMIFDNNFFVNRMRVLEFCRQLQKEGLQLRWQADICVDQILNEFSSQDLAEIRAAGGEVFFVGAESGSNDVLELLNKRITRDDTIAAAQKCRDAGIRVIYSFMTGFPGIYREEFRDTITLCNQLAQEDNTNEIILCTYTPYPGTELYRQFQHLLETPRSLSEWGQWSVFAVKGNWIDSMHKTRIRNASVCLCAVYGFFPWHSLQLMASKYSVVRLFLAPFKAVASWRLRHQRFRFHIERHIYSFVELVLRPLFL